MIIDVVIGVSQLQRGGEQSFSSHSVAQMTIAART